MPAAVAATLSLLPVGRQGRNVVGEGLGSGVPLGLCGQSGRLGWLNQLRRKIIQPEKSPLDANKAKVACWQSCMLQRHKKMPHQDLLAHTLQHRVNHLQQVKRSNVVG